jgi:hypothetical protein
VENQLAREHRRQKKEGEEISATENKRPLLEQSIKRREERRHIRSSSKEASLSLSLPSIITNAAWRDSGVCFALRKRNTSTSVGEGGILFLFAITYIR